MYIFVILSVFMIVMILNGLLLAVVFEHLHFIMDNTLIIMDIIMASSVTFLLYYYNCIP